MKTIKFRIYDKQQNKMIESGATPMMLKSFFEYTAVLHTRDEMPYQQFTGLLDKQGKEIYEGDIVKYRTHPMKTSQGIVVWSKNEPALKILDDHIYYSLSSSVNMVEVIGNIFENPELLN